MRKKKKISTKNVKAPPFLSGLSKNYSNCFQEEVDSLSKHCKRSTFGKKKSEAKLALSYEITL